MNIFGTAGMVFLIVLNITFVILGLGLIIAGGMLREKSETVNDKVLPLLNEIGIGPGFTMGDLLEAIAILVIIIGIIAFTLSTIGGFGACCKNRVLLIIYGIGVVLIGAAEIFVLKAWTDLKKELNETIKSTLLKLLKDYEGNTEDILTIAWNFVFLLFDCCGVNTQSSVDDFSTTTWASTTRGTDVIPGWCCKEAKIDTASSLYGTNCTITPTSSNSYYETGCYTAIEKILTTYSTTFISICTLILLVEILAVISAVVMVIQISNDVNSNRHREGIVLHNINKTSPTV
ncbi:tetraspanin-9-like [Mytilus californianus]|uniref:tetraspanin-9-like n=1 Tax=Mytilus californianus TaxID=6549 RepID=UPI002246A578|nr:tetraspanin-9-like [Mytilus californianus]